MPAIDTTQYLTPADVDEAAYAAFVAEHELWFLRSARRADRAGRGDCAGWTAAQCRSAAESLAACYRHQFRRLVPADPATRKPL